MPPRLNTKNNLVIVFAICIGIVFSGFALFHSCQSVRDIFSSGSNVAEYTDFYLISNSTKRTSDPKQEKFRTLTTSSSYGNIAILYVELLDGKRSLLSELPEEEVAKFYLKDPVLSNQLVNSYKSKNDTSVLSTFKFRNGKLIYARLDATQSLCPPVSATKEGPYVKLPINRETMLKVFGRPNKWVHYHPPSGP